MIVVFMGVANNELDKFVQNFVKNNECKINSEMKTWGREGEKDYCFRSRIGGKGDGARPL